MRCSTALSNIVARQEGWLSEAETADIDRHLSGCESCRRAFAADARIARDACNLPTIPVPRVTWSDVSTRTWAPSRRPVTRRILGPAMALAGAAALALVLMRSEAPTTTAPLGREQTESYATSAHLMLAAADPSADPNRALVALYDGGAGRSPQ